MEQMIGRSCASDSHTESFDIVIISEKLTNVTVSFEISPNNLIVAERDSIYRKLYFWDSKKEDKFTVRAMFPQEVEFHLKGFSRRSYPVQLKSVMQRVSENRIVQVKMNSGRPVNYTIQRCGWEIPGLEVIDESSAKSVLQLIERSCEDEWLDDSVNILIVNDKFEDTRGSIRFELITGSGELSFHRSGNISLKLVSTTTQPAALHVITHSKQMEGSHLWVIVIFSVLLFSLTVFIIFWLIRKSYIRLFKSGYYEVAKQEHYRLPSLGSHFNDIESIRYTTTEESF
ncbi:hypothetical protein CRE_27541 [Caenorhabditis remanei]|uniref:Uncharacterized protein n=1 Tax=Caenorhabditis remanei TaxID=31234 RepID=E3LP69_CAERE|nr:hypothetical protein CRE_27541 [Caenorhabditis remanei]